MPRMSDYEEYLDSSMIEDGDIIVLLDAGEFKENEKDGRKWQGFQIAVRLPDNRFKLWSVNKTTRKRLAKAYGDNSEDWMKKRVKIRITQQMAFGEIRDILWGYPVEEDMTTQAPLTTADTVLKEQPKQLVRFTKAYEDFKVEDTASFPSKTADSLINLGFTVPVDIT